VGEGGTVFHDQDTLTSNDFRRSHCTCGVRDPRMWRSAAQPGPRDRRMAWDGERLRASIRGRRSRSATSRESGLFPHPVRTAQIEITGTIDLTWVCSGPSSLKSVPAARERDARCIKVWCETSL
jgi:hypothetical protein